MNVTEIISEFSGLTGIERRSFRKKLAEFAPLKNVVRWSDRFLISDWDDTLAATARGLGAPALDLEAVVDGRSSEGARVVNSFRAGLVARSK